MGDYKVSGSTITTIVAYKTSQLVLCEYAGNLCF